MCFYQKGRMSSSRKLVKSTPCIIKIPFVRSQEKNMTQIAKLKPHNTKRYRNKQQQQ